MRSKCSSLLLFVVAMAGAVPQSILVVDARPPAAGTISGLGLLIHGRSANYIYVSENNSADARLAAAAFRRGAYPSNRQAAVPRLPRDRSRPGATTERSHRAA